MTGEETTEKRDPWPVPRERWSAYLEREVELAMTNIRRQGSSILSSEWTVQEAKRRISEVPHVER
jgi:hypothetical protein